MKHKRTFLLVLAIGLVLKATGQVTVTGTAYTEILNLVAAAEIVQMNFGKFSPDNGGGSITITPEGKRVTNGNIKIFEGPYSQGVFTVTGTGNNSLNIELPSTPQYLYHVNSIDRVYLDNWTFSIPKQSSDNAIINIGATLNFGPVNANPAGMYKGTYQVIFSYN